MVNKRKQAISESLSKIFGSTNNVKKVQYCNRLRLSFPCPEVACSFQTVDLKKHLLSKHRWDQLEVKLQLNYFNVMADYHTRLNTYKINQPAICFKCYLFFDRVDHHLARKLVDRNTDEYHSTLLSYRYNRKKVLASLQTHQYKIHSNRALSDTLIAANKFQSYGSFKHIKELNEDLHSLITSPKSDKLSKQKAIDVRDYLMVSLTYFNCFRASNLMNITLADISRMKPHNEIDGAHVITNTKYKTSMIYGAKIILISTTHVEQIQLCIEHLRPFVSKDDQ